MNLFGYEIKKRASKPDKQVTDFNMRWTGGTWVSYENTFDTYIKEGFLRNPHLGPIVTAILDKAISVPFYVSKIKNQQGVAKYESLTGKHATEASLMRAKIMKAQVLEEVKENDPASKLLENPNESQTFSDFLADMVGYDCLLGEQILGKQGVSLRATGLPLEMYSLPPHLITFIADEKFLKVKNYRWQPDNVDIDPSMVIVGKRWNPMIYDAFHLRGMSPIRAMLSTLQTSNEAQLTIGKMLANQGPPALLFPDSEGILGNTKITELKELFVSYISKRRRGEIAVHPTKVGKLDLGVTPVDLAILESELASKQNLCNAYHVDSLLFGNTEGRSGTAAELEYARKRMVLDAVQPVLVRTRSVINQVFKPAGYFIDFDLSVLPEMQTDMKAMAEALEKMPYVTYKEKREFTGWLPDERTEYQELLNDYFVPNSSRPYLMGDSPAPDQPNDGTY